MLIIKIAIDYYPDRSVEGQFPLGLGSQIKGEIYLKNDQLIIHSRVEISVLTNGIDLAKK